MIRLSDTLILALAKLRTRRVRTAITVTTAGLLFGGMIATLSVVQGTIKSVEEFSQAGFGSRYIVSGMPMPANNGLMRDKQVQARAVQINDGIIADKVKQAKKIGAMYDAKSEPQPVTSYDDQEPYLNMMHPAAKQAIEEFRDKYPSADEKEFRTLALQYDAKAFYSSANIAPRDGNLIQMKDGKEEFDSRKQQELDNADSRSGRMPIGDSLVLSPDQLTNPFMAPGHKTEFEKNIIPVVLPYSIVQELLKLEPLAKTVSASERVERLKYVREHAKDASIDVCYRNTASQEKIASIEVQRRVASQAKSDKNTPAPSLLYGYPAADTCGDAVTTKDSRSTNEKQASEKQQQFERLFSKNVDPAQRKLKLQVVGVAPDAPGSGAESSSQPVAAAMDIVTLLASSSLYGQWAVPDGLFKKTANYDELRNLLQTRSLAGFAESMFQTYYAEFDSADQARAFIKEQTCSFDSSECTKRSPFMLTSFGSNNIALEDAKHAITKGFQIVASIVAAIAVIVMSGTIGRVIADGRRETAVFRAIGAKRLDIASIYSVYTLLLALRVLIFATVLGLGVAYVVDILYQKEATVQAQLAFGVDNNSVFHLFTPWSGEIVIVLGLIVITSLVAMLFPLLRNIRRNPINDMRDE